MHVIRNDDGTMEISSKERAKTITDQLGNLSKHTPMSLNLHLAYDIDTSNTTKQVTYRSNVGKLLYLALTTRPDIAYATSYLARFMHCRTQLHHAALKHLLQYLY